jgi:hypothetical protein
LAVVCRWCDEVGGGHVEGHTDRAEDGRIYGGSVTMSR